MVSFHIVITDDSRIVLFLICTLNSTHDNDSGVRLLMDVSLLYLLTSNTTDVFVSPRCLFCISFRLSDSLYPL